jgi:adenylate cyclase
VFSEKKSSLKKSLISAAVAFILITSAVFIYKKYSASGDNCPQPKTIAILPFANLSAQKDDEYFSDSMCNEIQTQLSKIGAINIISRTSMLQFKDTKRTMKEIGEAVGTDMLLEYSVQKASDKVHINMQMIDTKKRQTIVGR